METNHQAKQYKFGWGGWQNIIIRSFFDEDQQCYKPKIKQNMQEQKRTNQEAKYKGHNKTGRLVRFRNLLLTVTIPTTDAEENESINAAEAQRILSVGGKRTFFSISARKRCYQPIFPWSGNIIFLYAWL